MQDRYAGDIGDYIKSGLIRALSLGYNVGIAWYLYPDETHNADGRHTAYLANPEFWKPFDPELFDALSQIIRGRRSVGAIETSGVLNASYYSECIVRGLGERTTHRDFRICWFERLKAALKHCDLVFVDPDNGLVRDAHAASQLKASGKKIPLGEALALAEGRVAIVYHHNSRFKGGHGREVEHWLAQLGPRVIAVRANAYSCRTFFVINPDDVIKYRLAEFCARWSPAKVRLHAHSEN